MDSLHLTDFRNHESLIIPLASVTVVSGANGSGKTAILEALSFISMANSWKVERDAEVVRWDQPFSRILLGEREVVIQASPSYKRYRVDGISKRLTDILGTFPTVLFQPDDSALIHGSPASRRQFMDRLLSQTEFGYAKALTTLQKVLKQRNRLLKQIQERSAGEEQLQYWDEELVTLAQTISRAREHMIEGMRPLIIEQYKKLMPEGKTISLEYHYSPSAVEKDLQQHLIKNRFKEIQAGTTLYGPHREDIEFFYGEYAACTCLSRGQVRALVLALKLAEVAYVEQSVETPPLLLLDDVFAEFDHDRREKILHLVEKYQSVLTVTDLMGVENHLPGHAGHVVL